MIIPPLWREKSPSFTGDVQQREFMGLPIWVYLAFFDQSSNLKVLCKQSLISLSSKQAFSASLVIVGVSMLSLAEDSSS